MTAPDPIDDGQILDAMSAAEIAALLHFHAEAGVEWLLEDDPVDRIAAFAAERGARAGRPGAPAVQDEGGFARPAVKNDAMPAVAPQGGPPVSPPPTSEPAAPQAARAGARGRGGSAEPAPRPPSTRVAIPDEQAVAEARVAAGGAQSLAELRTALEGFTGCNLRNSARSLVFAEGDPASGLMIVGPAPNGDDDRDGRPFSGRQGGMLDRMLAAVGLTRDRVLLTNVIPWRPPGNRMPSAREMEICRPFLDRQFALARPRRVLVLGNFAARFFFGGSDTIHEMRGDWRTILASGETVRALATLHPQDLFAAPICKRLAWQDLQMFAAPDGDPDDARVTDG